MAAKKKTIVVALLITLVLILNQLINSESIDDPDSSELWSDWTESEEKDGSPLQVQWIGDEDEDEEPDRIFSIDQANVELLDFATERIKDVKNQDVELIRTFITYQNRTNSRMAGSIHDDL